MSEQAWLGNWSEYHSGDGSGELCISINNPTVGAGWVDPEPLIATLTFNFQDDNERVEAVIDFIEAVGLRVEIWQANTIRQWWDTKDVPK